MKYLWPLLCIACFGQGNVLPDTNLPPGKDVKRIQGAGALMRADWMSSRWARPGDVLEPMVLFVVALDGTACVVEGPIWAVAKYGDTVQCSPWRVPR